MSFFNKIFGAKSTAPGPATILPAAQKTAPSNPAKDSDKLRVFDAYGREMFITKETWRKDVLPGVIKTDWSNPDRLSATIIQSLKDGFVVDVVKPAEHLAEIDPNHERSAVILSIVYRELNRLDDAERAIRKHIECYGESGIVLTNLAKIQSGRGDKVMSLQTLWHGLELDPNQDNGLAWYEVLHREKEGPAGGIAALRRIATLSKSWRARLWLARDALVRHQLDEAIQLYEEAISFAPCPLPGDMLQQISGDLGINGHLPEKIGRAHV